MTQVAKTDCGLGSLKTNITQKPLKLKLASHHHYQLLLMIYILKKKVLIIKKNYIELVEQVLKYDHNSYGYIENFHEIHNDFKVGSDGFLTEEQLSEIQDSSELYKFIRDVYNNAPKVLTDFNKEEK